MKISFFSSILLPQTIQLATWQSLVPVHKKRSVISCIQSKQFRRKNLLKSICINDCQSKPGI